MNRGQRVARRQYLLAVRNVRDVRFTPKGGH
jgi:hypothetical protein